MSSRTRVYIGKLSSRTRERDIEDVFSRFGRITACDLKYGYAFVEYEDPRDAEDAVRELDGYNLDSSRIIVEFSRGGRRAQQQQRGGYTNNRPPQRSEYRVAIEGLPREISWQDLKDHFRKAGDVLFTDVFSDAGRTKGVVEFKSRDDVRRAIREMNDTELRGSRIYCREDDSRGSRRRGSSYSPRRSRSPRRRRSRSPRRRSRSRSRSHSPRRQRSPPRRRSRSPAQRRRSRSRSRSRSPVAKKASPSPVRAGSPTSARPASPARSRSRSRSRSPVKRQGSPDENSGSKPTGSPSRSPTD